MSSSPRADRRLPRPVSLRAKLTAQLVAVVAAVCVLIALFTELALHRFLMDQLDSQLTGATERAHNQAEGRPPPRDQPGGPNGPIGGPPGGLPGDPPFRGRPNPLNAPGQGPGTLNAVINPDGTVQSAGRFNSRGSPEDVSDAGQQQLAQVPRDGRKYTRDIVGFGDYRLTTVTIGQGDTLVTGLPLSDVDKTMWTVGFILGGFSLVALAAAFGAGSLIVRRTLRPLQRVAATAGRVVELPLDRGEVPLSVRVPEVDTDPRTEVGQVGAALNRMLGHIGNALAVRHASETRVRQFVADASHELRTPLAAIRGYAELTRRSRDEVPADIAYAMSRVESESNRMTTLVNDLLLLARLDSGRPLETEEVDLSRLVVDAVNDARIAGRDHLWRLDIPEDPVTVTGDTQRLHQVLANLLANARTHTPPGTTVTTAVSEIPDYVRITVTDDGPGIPPELMPEIFERFSRGERSRSRAAGSTGLGLAIVAAVVAAHRGTVEVASMPGHTQFIVTLPHSA
jgi:two-component system OmpR family sensor kinase